MNLVYFILEIYIIIATLVKADDDPDFEVKPSQYIGCFNDNPNDKYSFTKKAARLVQNNLGLCASRCSLTNFLSFGVTQVGHCICFNTGFSAFGQVADQACLNACELDARYSNISLFRCGGSMGQISVYWSCPAQRFNPSNRVCQSLCFCEQLHCYPISGQCYLPGCAKGVTAVIDTSGNYKCPTRDCSFFNGECATWCSSADAISIVEPACKCQRGYYVPDGSQSCEDFDECIGISVNCQTCINTIGSFRCLCADHVDQVVVDKNGARCQKPVGFCAQIPNPCAVKQQDTFRCVEQLDGHVDCICGPGFETDGLNCIGTAYVCRSPGVKLSW